MMLRAEVVQTGSSGNCVVLEKKIALDAGVPFYKILPYLKDLQVVFVGHEHSDHFKESTIRRLAKARPSLRFAGGEFMVRKFLDAGVHARNIDVLEAGHLYNYGSFQIEPVELHHDVPCYGLKLWINGERAVYFVDTGDLEGITASGFDLYLVEANHYEWEIEKRASDKLAAGQFAYEIRAANNHLSFEQATAWLAENMATNPTSVWIPLHLHEERREDDAEQIPERVDMHQ